MEEPIRSFIAIELPALLKGELTRLQTQLKTQAGNDVRWVDPKGIHITLQFLGDVPANRLDAVTKAIQNAAEGISPFHLQVGGLGVFPNPKRVRVVWVGLTGQLDLLRTLQKRIEERLKPLGFAPEMREFTPHLTLGRVRENASPQARERLGQLIIAANFQAGTPVEARAVHLMRSQLTRAGAIYSRTSTVTLA